MAGNIEVSFEFFPPKSDSMRQTLGSALELLAPLDPRFVSMTCGAGGKGRTMTEEAIEQIAETTRIPPAAHLTCVGVSRDETDTIARRYWDKGIRHIVALRGDPPEGNLSFTPHPDGYANAAELVAGLRAIAPFEISVAAYPDCHPQSPSRAADLDNLKAKIDAGATRAITQFFFSADSFFRFRDDAAAAGITAELVPGILPVSNIAQTRKFASLCGTSIPSWMDRLFDGLDDVPEARQMIAANVAGELCGLLYAGGVRHFHFYTLNRGELAYATCRLLGLQPKDRADGHRRSA
jgi:methylenetetrahydrofolate reductase (NADPH)